MDSSSFASTLIVGEGIRLLTYIRSLYRASVHATLMGNSRASPQLLSRASTHLAIHGFCRRRFDLFAIAQLASQSLWKLDIDPLWRRCLADLDPEELQRGVTELGHQGAEWPPSLPEFRKLCHPPAEAPAPPCHRLLPRDAPETAEQKAARKVRGRAALDSIYKRMPHLRCGHRGPNPGKRDRFHTNT